MTVYRVLADIVDALRTSHLEHEGIRQEMATKKDLAALESAAKDEFAAVRREIAALAAATRSEFAAVRQEMATKKDLAALEAATRSEFAAVRREMAEHSAGLRKLGLEFETFRHDSKITLDMILELMTRTNRHETAIVGLDRRTSRVENHLKLRPLPPRQEAT